MLWRSQGDGLSLGLVYFGEDKRGKVWHFQSDFGEENSMLTSEDTVRFDVLFPRPSPWLRHSIVVTRPLSWLWNYPTGSPNHAFSPTLHSYKKVTNSKLEFFPTKYCSMELLLSRGKITGQFIHWKFHLLLWNSYQIYMQWNLKSLNSEMGDNLIYYYRDFV